MRLEGFPRLGSASCVAHVLGALILIRQGVTPAFTRDANILSARPKIPLIGCPPSGVDPTPLTQGLCKSAYLATRSGAGSCEVEVGQGLGDTWQL